ncbi:MAG TPA: serine/threonine-protein kinase [Bryobacteraceae bacterium]|nr:serine/threonine-protein kinase [Bryobacteraceae bacterium]
MTREHWQRMEDIFNQAIAADESARIDFVRQLCQGDEELFSDVQRLLVAFVEDRRYTPPQLANTRVFGEYRIDREIGHGGMGTVYLAQRADGEFEQQVALKMVSPHLRSQLFTERFRAERQILAQLSHPNITRLLDGGVGENGDPYLAMEYVDGQPLDRYCDELRLTVPGRIRLLLQVCSAVEYAHRNLIVHRDLKPGNIFVTRDGTPKLLDFGTAKLLNTDGAGSTTTRLGMMTPRYASPEQMRGDPVTTVSDVFSLGVILFELVTGAWPFGDPDSPSDCLRRAAVEVEPTRPSSVITDEAARLRSVSRTRLARIADGDLRSVIGNAIQADPRRRYQSVEQFAADLERYLNGRAVLARRGTWLYHAGKFIRRHRLGVSAAVLFVIVLAGSAVYSARQAQLARAEAQKSALVTEFIRGILGSADPTGEGGSKNITVLEALNQARAQLSELNTQPMIKAYLHYTLGITYDNLQDFRSAEEQMRSAVDISRRYGSPTELAWAEASLGSILLAAGRYVEEAETLLRDAVSVVRKQGKNADPQLVNVAVGNYFRILWGRHGHSPQVEALGREAIGVPMPQTSKVTSNYKFAQYLIEEHRDREAADLLDEGIRIERGLVHPTASLGFVDHVYSALRAGEGDWVGAERYARLSRDEISGQYGPDNPATLSATVVWAAAWSKLGHAVEADHVSENALASLRRVAALHSYDFWPALLARASILNDATRWDEAEEAARESLAAAQSANPDDPRSGQSWAELGIALLGQRRIQEGAIALDNADRIDRKLPGWSADHYATKRIEQALAAARRSPGAASRQ